MSISTRSSVIFPLESSPAYRGKDLVPVEDPVLGGGYLFRSLYVKMRHDPEHAIPIKTSVCCEYMKVRIESQKIAERLNGNDGARNCLLFPAKDGIFDWHGFLEKRLQCFPAASTQFEEKSSIIEEVSSEELWNAKNKMTVRYGLEDFFTEPFPEFHRPLLMTRWTEVAALAREG